MCTAWQHIPYYSLLRTVVLMVYCMGTLTTLELLLLRKTTEIVEKYLFNIAKWKGRRWYEDLVRIFSDIVGGIQTA